MIIMDQNMTMADGTKIMMDGTIVLMDGTSLTLAEGEGVIIDAPMTSMSLN